MKITLRRDHNGNLTIYVPKKDLEQDVIATENSGLWGGVISLANGWKLQLPDMPETTPLPVTVEARKVEDI